MGSVPPESRPGAVDRAVMQFDALWADGIPSLERFWAELGPGASLGLLSALIKDDLFRRFERGERPRAADYLARFPELGRDNERAISIIYEEFCLLEEGGEGPSSREFCEAYAPWSDSLASQLVHHRELSRIAGVAAPKIRFPAPGERFGSFRLRSILGKGGAAQVYLATDEGLGDRRVALKITASVGREPSILANLDHRGIVPILMVAESAETGLRGICMPYRPGETLEKLIGKLGRNKLPWKAKAVWDALRPSLDCPDDDLDAERSGWAGFPIRGSYHEAVAFIGLALANATGYLHARNVNHRDIKPANILLAYREGPQLLDFNLAYAPNQPEHAQAALKGGTLPYMAPEQLRAFLDPSCWDLVNSGADIYSLGLVLKELATGVPPEAPDPRMPLPRAILALHDRRAGPVEPIRRIMPRIPPALESIIARCLAFRPADRYQKAEFLAEDLRRFLDRRPLQDASNTSLVERGSNFVYRNSIGAAVLILLAIFSALFGMPAAPAPAPPATAVEQREDFRQALEDYQSGDLARVERARATFAMLATKDLKSARPFLYLGLAMEKLGQSDEANAKFGDAQAQPDLALSLDEALGREPGSPALRTLKAARLLPLGKHQEAIDLLKPALEVQPDRVGALKLIAELERKTNQNRLAIGHLRRAIAVGEAKPPGREIGDELLRLRSIIITLLAKEVDGEIGPDAAPSLPSEGLTSLGEIEEHLVKMERAWAGGLGNGTQAAFVLARERGSLASDRAVFEARMGMRDAAAGHFEEALGRFRECPLAIPGSVKREDRRALLKDIEARIARVEARRRALLGPAG